MNRFFRTLILLTLVFAALTIPALAQDTVPAAGFVLDWKDIVILAQFALIALLVFGNYRSVSPEFAKFVFDYLKDQAAKTPATWDDEAVAVGAKLADGLLHTQPPATSTPPKFTASGNLTADLAALKAITPAEQ